MVPAVCSNRGDSPNQSPKMAGVTSAFNSAILSGGSLLPTVFELLAQEALTEALRTASEYTLKVSLGYCGS